jgi:ABC-type protease/lipase transport system fused ATPase/permease subunit
MSIRRIHWLGMVCIFGSLVVICSAFLSEVLPQGRLDEIKKSITKINQLLSDSQKEKLSLLSAIQMSRSQLDYRTELILNSISKIPISQRKSLIWRKTMKRMFRK